MEGVTVTVDRYETTLDEALWVAMKQYDQVYAGDNTVVLAEVISDEMIYGLAIELLLDYGVLS